MYSRELVIRTLPTGLKIEKPEVGFSARFTHGGHWCTARIKGSFYRRCIDGVVLVNNCPDNTVNPMTIQKQLQVICSELLANPEKEISGTKEIQIVLSADSDFFTGAAQLYRRIFPEGVPVLPPDRYGDFVLPVTTGCPSGRCTFCAFYRNRPLQLLHPEGYQTASDDSYDNYFSKIRHLLGSGRSGLFLGSANALALPPKILTIWLCQIKRHLSCLSRGVACFGDADHISDRAKKELTSYAKLGLQFVVLGLETGSPQLRGTLNKQADITKTVALVADLQQVGIAVGLTVLTGFILPDHFEQHLVETVAAIETMKLSPKDRVYVSPWFAHGQGVPNERAVHEMKIMAAELRRITNAKVVGYCSNNFFYFA